MPLSHEQAVRFGRKGGLRRGKKVTHYTASLTIRVPDGLKEWYERRAEEEGVDLSELIRDILQGKRSAITGKPIA